MTNHHETPSKPILKRRSRIVYLCFGFTISAVFYQLFQINAPQYKQSMKSRRISLGRNASGKTNERQKFVTGTRLSAKNLRSSNRQTGTFPLVINSSEVTRAGFTPEQCLKPRSPIWEWHFYSRSASKQIAKKRLLIALYSGFGAYGRLLELTAPINKAYGKKWRHDVVVLQGAALRLSSEKHCEPPAHRATFNKIPLLQQGIKRRADYDQLLILDTDAMIYDMNRDLTTLLPSNHVLAAQGVHSANGFHTWDINAGVTLWDLRHPQIQKLTREWDQNSRKGMQDNYHASNDQFHLHWTLKMGNYTHQTYAFQNEFKYGNGTVIKHFIRSVQHKGWSDPDILNKREDRIAQAARNVCHHFSPVCDGIEKRSYVG